MGISQIPAHSSILQKKKRKEKKEKKKRRELVMEL